MTPSLGITLPITVFQEKQRTVTPRGSDIGFTLSNIFRFNICETNKTASKRGDKALRDIVLDNLQITLKIILFVGFFMTIIDFLEIRHKEKINQILTGRPLNQYVLSSLLGSIPGCIDAFLVVSLYLHGVVGFGGLAAVMISTAGDEAFVMLAMVPEAAYKIFALLIPLGIIGGFLADRVIEHFQVERRKVSIDIEEHTEIVDYFKEHVYNHIIKQHIPRLFTWIFLTLTIIELMMQRFDLASIISNMPTSSLIIFAALVGIIPESGPHMIFLVLYSKGLIPFSVLLVSTLSQDGHGLLPLLSHSVKDTIHVQIFTTIFSLIVGFLVILVSNIT